MKELEGKVEELGDLVIATAAHVLTAAPLRPGLSHALLMDRHTTRRRPKRHTKRGRGGENDEDDCAVRDGDGYDYDDDDDGFDNDDDDDVESALFADVGSTSWAARLYMVLHHEEGKVLMPWSESGTEFGLQDDFIEHLVLVGQGLGLFCRAHCEDMAPAFSSCPCDHMFLAPGQPQAFPRIEPQVLPAPIDGVSYHLCFCKR